jgi:hypothetical protein
LQEIFEIVVHRCFYSVGREQFLNTDITHEEMVELVKMACQNQARDPHKTGQTNT